MVKASELRKICK